MTGHGMRIGFHMTIKPFIERNTTVDEYAPDPDTKRRGFGLFMLNGWCVVGVEYDPRSMSKSGYVWPWSLALIMCNIAVGLWNDPD